MGGGTGVYTVLSSLKNKNLELSAIVSMCDDGGSTGRLRDDYGVLPPGDIRRSLVALSSAENQLRKLFEHRFANGGLAGHNFGNIFLAALEKTSGNFYNGVKLASQILSVKGNVVPVTLDDVRLYAKLENGKIIKGETNIDIPKHNPKLKITSIYTKPRGKANPDAIKKILEADFIIIGPGDLYTSILPNLLISGVSNALRKTKAKKIYICNLMTKKGETNKYTGKDFVENLENYLGKNVLDYVLINNKKPGRTRLQKYSKQRSEIVIMPRGFKPKGLIKSDLITNKGFIRHDTKKLGRLILKIINT